MDKIFKTIKSQLFSLKEEKFLVTLSGGVDSVVLCYLFSKAGVNFSIAHCNYGLRGEDSDMDEVFVRNLAKEYGVELFVKRFDTLSLKKNRESIQMLARELRYSWFKDLCSEHGFTRIATAHHANDCFETALLNLARGTSLRGVCNMLISDPAMVRPLIGHTKEEIRQYAMANNLRWREDASNKKDDYRRNFVRNNVMTEFKKLNPKLETTLISSLGRLSQVQHLWGSYVDDLKERIVKKVGETLVIEIAEIQNAPWAALALYEILSSYKFSYHQIANSLKAGCHCGGKIFSKTHAVYADRDRWLVVKNDRALETFYDDTISDGEVSFSCGPIHLATKTIAAADYTIIRQATVAALDKRLLKFPLKIRKWLPGDYFYPLGMKNRKKVSDFFVDKKISVVEKESAHVILSGNDIVWIVGYRVDDRYKVTAETGFIYEMKIALGANNI